MSRMADPSQFFMSVKKEIKEEDFHDFLQYSMDAFQQEKPTHGNEPAIKIESYTSLKWACKEEYLAVETKTTDTSEIQDSCHLSMLLRFLYCNVFIYSRTQIVVNVLISCV